MKTPWHYLAWIPPQLEPKAERDLAAMTRSIRRGGDRGFLDTTCVDHSDRFRGDVRVVTACTAGFFQSGIT